MEIDKRSAIINRYYHSWTVRVPWRLWIRDINPARFNAEGDGIVDGSIHAPTQVFHDQSSTIER